MGRSMGLAAALLDIRKSRWRFAAYIPLAVALGILLFLGLGLTSIWIMGFFVFAIPYWFGERRIRRLAGAALVILVATSLLVAFIFTLWNLGQTPTLQDSPDSLLRDGQVSPYRGSSDSTLFNFTVVYAGGAAPLEGPLLNLSVTGATSSNRTLYPMVRGEATTGGRLYFFTTRLPTSFYSYHFQIRDANGTWVATQQRSGGLADSAGPYTLGGPALFAAFAPSLLSYYLLFTFLIPPVVPLVLLLYWWGRQIKVRRERFLGIQRPGKCPDCGAAILGADARECPVCGKALALGAEPAEAGEAS